MVDLSNQIAENIINNTQNTFNHFLQNNLEYNILSIKQNLDNFEKEQIIDVSNLPDMSNKSNQIKSSIENILTTNIIEELIKNEENVLLIISIITKVYQNFLTQYLNNSNLKKNNNYFKFIFKGGLSLSIQINNALNNLPKSIRDVYKQKYGNNFKRSDMDFTIFIDYNLILQENIGVNLENIFNDIHNISFIILFYVRNYLNTNNIFDFFNYKKENQKNKLNKMLVEIINNVKQIDDSKKYCKISFGDLNKEMPCPNNVEYKNNFNYDKLITNDPTTNTNKIIYTPKQIGQLNFEPQNKYIVSSNLITINSPQNKKMKFGLTRMKVFFGIYNYKYDIMENIECCDFTRKKGELFDITINHYEDNNHLEMNDMDYHILNIDNNDVLTYSLLFFVRELGSILSNGNFPWENAKYKKRLDRMFGIYYLTIIEEYLQSGIFRRDVEDYIDKLFEFTRLFNVIFIDGTFRNSFGYLLYQLNLNDPSFTVNNERNYKNLLVFLIKICDKIYQNQPVDVNNFNDFIKYCNENIQNLKEIIKTTNNYIGTQIIKLTELNNNINFGGSQCQDEGFMSKIYKHIIKLSGNDLNQNMTTKFNNLINELISEYNNNNNPTNQFLNQQIISGMSLNITHKKNMQILMFLSFIMEYYLFLIVYQNNDFNTESTPNDIANQRKFKRLNWFEDNENKNDYYKDALLNKNIIDIIKEYCNQIDSITFRFLEILINTLVRKIPATTESQIKNIIFFKFDETKYDSNIGKYLFFDWKKRLFDIYKQRVINIEDIIENAIYHSINNISRQNNINEIYNADGLGMFSRFFYFSKSIKSNNKNNYVSQCFCSTLLEQYLYSFVYENFSNHGTLSQDNGRHNFWIHTQNEMNRNIEHMGTWYKKSNNNIKHHRYLEGYLNNENLLILDYKQRKKANIHLFILTLIDYRFAFLVKNRNYLNDVNIKRRQLMNVLNLVKGLIN